MCTAYYKLNVHTYLLHLVMLIQLLSTTVLRNRDGVYLTIYYYSYCIRRCVVLM